VQVFIHICVKHGKDFISIFIKNKIFYLSMPLTLTSDQIVFQAKRLDVAETDRIQIRPTTVSYPDMTIEDAYHIQDAWIQEKLSRGRTIIGHKVGLTSKVMQKAMSINESDFGILLDDMVFEDGAEIITGDFLDPRIEVEIAFKLSKDLDPNGLTIQHVIDASSHIIPSLELIAARSFRLDPQTGYKRTVKDTISDNAANAGIIIGRDSIPKETDLSWVGAVIRKNGVIEESGISGAVLDHPANAVIWLSQKYAEIDRTLKAGQIILAGSFTRPITVKAGDRIVADFNQYGTVSCSFI